MHSPASRRPANTRRRSTTASKNAPYDLLASGSKHGLALRGGGSKRLLEYPRSRQCFRSSCHMGPVLTSRWRNRNGLIRIGRLRLSLTP
eukprot:14456392-Alexandrium_andersonii.AAC.1